MRELTVFIRFTKDCLGNVKKYLNDPKTGQKWPVFFLPRTPDGKVRLEAAWWKSNIRFAAEVLCKHQRVVDKIHFDISVEGIPHPIKGFYKRYFDSKRYVKHEAFKEGDVIAVNCIVPSEISDDDFRSLMELVGRFRGISPYGPREFGFFTVEAINRRLRIEPHENNDIPGRECAPHPSVATNSSAPLDRPSAVHTQEGVDDQSGARCS